METTTITQSQIQLTRADTVVAGSTIIRNRYDSGVMIEPSSHLVERAGFDAKENRVVFKCGYRIFTYRPADLVMVVAGAMVPDPKLEDLVDMTLRGAGITEETLTKADENLDDVWQVG